MDIISILISAPDLLSSIPGQRQYVPVGAASSAFAVVSIAAVGVAGSCAVAVPMFNRPGSIAKMNAARRMYLVKTNIVCII
jgi:hypothetical protein